MNCIDALKPKLFVGENRFDIGFLPVFCFEYEINRDFESDFLSTQNEMEKIAINVKS